MQNGQELLQRGAGNLLQSGAITITKCTAWKVSKCGVISGPYFPVFSPNTGKYRPEITPYLDTSHAVVRKLYYKVGQVFQIGAIIKK